MDQSIWILNLLSTTFMIGLIWFVQIVHYPLSSYVAEERFSDYQSQHMVRTTGVVTLPMVVESLTAGYLAYRPPAFGPAHLWWIGFVLVLVNLLSTYFLQKPAHEKLRAGFHADTHDFLVSTNWIRTVSWSARGVLWFVLLLHRLK